MYTDFIAQAGFGAIADPRVVSAQPSPVDSLFPLKQLLQETIQWNSIAACSTGNNEASNAFQMAMHKATLAGDLAKRVLPTIAAPSKSWANGVLMYLAASIGALASAGRMPSAGSAFSAAVNKATCGFVQVLQAIGV